MRRDVQVEYLRNFTGEFDIVVIGGGASGAGVAADAASRGYSVVLLEQSDFGKGTSSRSTKLVHGGVRYLAQGDVPLVREALHERAAMLRNAPHVVRPLGFVIPAKSLAEAAYYRAGIGVYDILAGSERFAKSAFLSRRQTLLALPGLRAEGIRAGVLFHDGQFDDARYLLSLIATALKAGAVAASYVRAESLLHDSSGRLRGVGAVDLESGQSFEIRGRAVVNATGAFSDRIRTLQGGDAVAMLSTSQGSHIVLDRSFLPSQKALLVPKTSDGRVLFAIPWHGFTLVGTTDVPIPDAPLEPVPSAEEIDFILETAGGYLARRPKRKDVLSTFAGIRPLIRTSGASTAELSRSHSVFSDRSGLISLLGGKWTTYRAMAQECVDYAAKQAGLPWHPSATANLRLADAPNGPLRGDHLDVYGSERGAVEALMKERAEFSSLLHPEFPYTAAQVVWAVRHEMARSVEDVLARRLRMLFLHAAAAVESAPAVAALMAAELGHGAEWVNQQVASFRSVAQGYMLRD